MTVRIFSLFSFSRLAPCESTGNLIGSDISTARFSLAGLPDGRMEYPVQNEANRHSETPFFNAFPEMAALKTGEEQREDWQKAGCLQ